MKNHNGFTLIEVVIAIALLAIVAALVVPRIRRSGLPVHQKFLQQLNNLTRAAQLNALMTRKTHKIFFDLKKKRAVTEIDSGKTDSSGKPVFQPLDIPYENTAFDLSEKLEFERFAIKGKELMQKGAGYRDAWFFITPDGLTQETTIGLYEPDRDRHFTVIINPFTAQFGLT